MSSRRAITKQLHGVIRDIHNKFSIDCDDIYIAGGAISSLFRGEEVKDYDVYFRNEAAKRWVVNQLIILFKEETSLYTYDYSHNPYISSGDFVITENAILLKSKKIQFITRYIGEPVDMVENFDFIHAKNFFHRDELTVNVNALESILTNQLIYTGSEYPVTSLYRMKRFLKRGWNISAGEITKIALQVSTLNLLDPVVLKQQLVGIDTLYMLQFLKMVEDHSRSNANASSPLTYTYLASVLDEVFN
jgi:hypothetical protein